MTVFAGEERGSGITKEPTTAGRRAPATEIIIQRRVRSPSCDRTLLCLCLLRPAVVPLTSWGQRLHEHTNTGKDQGHAIGGRSRGSGVWDGVQVRVLLVLTPQHPLLI